MIEVECPACEQMFAIEDSQLGSMVACPHCQQPVDMSGALEDEMPAPALQGPQKKRIVVQKGGGTFQAPVAPVPQIQIQPVATAPQQIAPGPGQQMQPPQQMAPVRQPAPGPAYGSQPGRAPMKVVVTDIKMPLGSMVVFMLKMMVASIPAMLIMSLVIGLLSMLLGGIIAGIFGAAAASGAGG